VNCLIDLGGSRRISILAAETGEQLRQVRGITRAALLSLLALHAAPLSGDLATDHGQRQGDQLFRAGNIEFLLAQPEHQAAMD
jgi:hypothetical protein